MDKKVGFIGCGNMASAMIGGIIKSKTVLPCNLIVSNRSHEKLIAAKEKYNINIAESNGDAALFSDILILSVKPDKYSSVINEIKNNVKSNAIIVTIAAGISIYFVEKCFGRKMKIVRTMPNTSAQVGESMTAVCQNNMVNSDDLNNVVKIFESFGKVELINEDLMDIIPAVSSSSPAFIYMFIEAMGDGAVLQGFPRDKAYKMAAQAVYGAAKMVLESGQHPALLKDSVCSPGGTTIEAIYTLEKNNFRASIISAMESCTNKAIKMSHDTAEVHENE